ncbi:hypothetical protein STEG23_002187 [Scotinomys teguina]
MQREEGGGEVTVTINSGSSGLTVTEDKAGEMAPSAACLQREYKDPSLDLKHPRKNLSGVVHDYNHSVMSLLEQMQTAGVKGLVRATFGVDVYLRFSVLASHAGDEFDEAPSH